MSTKVDSRVVEMRFDNSHFEKNTKQTMSTLDKLKQKLNFSGASKGLDELNSSANKVNMKGMSGALDTVHSKFSALEIMGVTALANITNSAVNAGKRMLSALTIDPVKTGLSEYETQINAIQTIMANVGQKGKTLEDVNKALEELNKYADQTIYNFTEMTKNIGLFTNAGVDLDTSVAAIKGFSNAAAMAGTDATRTAGAMYQLSQAMSSGRVLLMDWRSLEQANITGQRFQETIKMTARAHGIAIDEMIANEGSLRDTLKDGWLTSDLMAEALNHYTLSLENMTEAEIKANRERLKSLGYTEEQIDQLFELGTEATNAATKVKTFSQLWGVLQETAQSGWAKTWQIIIGDFEEAKNLLTPLANFLTKIIDKFSDARNALLEGALGKNWRNLFEGVTKPIRTVVESVQEYAQLVDDIISGKWGNAPTRWQSLEAAGYDWAHAQNLVNEKLGNSLRRSTNYTETQHKIAEGNVEVTETTKDLILELTKLSDAELKAKGYSDDFIKSLRNMQNVARKTGIPLKQFIANLDKIDGRWILMNSFKNLGLSLVTVFRSIGDAWRNAFPAATSDQLFDIIAGFHKFSLFIKNSVDENADELTRTLKGLFAILDIIVSFFRVSFKVAFTAARAVLGLFNLDILEFTALVGDALVRLRDFLDNNNILTQFIEAMSPHVITLCKAIGNWIWHNETINKGIKVLKKTLSDAWVAIDAWFEGLKNTDNVPKYIFDGLIKGLKNGAKIAWDTMVWIGKSLIEVFCAILGIHSPSTVFFEIGKNIVQGLYNGISNFIKMVYNLVMSIGNKIIEIIKDLDIGSIFTIALGTGAIAAFVNIAKAFNRLTGPLDGLGDVFEESAKGIKRFSKAASGLMKALSFKIVVESVKSLAIAVAILAGSLAVLTMVDQDNLWRALGAITALVVLLGALTYVVGTFGGEKGVEFGKIALTIVGLSVAMAIMAKALKTVASIDPERYEQSVKGILAIMAAMGVLVYVVGDKGAKFKKLGTSFLGIAAAILIMGIVAKMLGKMDTGEMAQGVIAMGLFTGLIVGLMAIAKTLTGSRNIKNIGKSIRQIATAMILMLIVVKIAGNMKPDELAQGLNVITLFGLLIVGFIAATKKLLTSTKDIAGMGGLLFSVAGALLLMVFVAKVAATMNVADLVKGTVAIAAFGAMIVGLMYATKFVKGGKTATKIGGTLLMIAAAIGVMALTAALLSVIDLGGLAKGIVAVGLLTGMVAGLMVLTKTSKKMASTIWSFAGAIGVLAISIGLLSLIKPEKLIPATTAISLVIGMFGLLVAATGKSKKAIATVLVLTGVVAALAVVLWRLSTLPANQTLAAAGALSLLLGSLALVMVLISKMGALSAKALLGVAGLVAITGSLYLVVDVLKRMSGVDNAIQNATVLAAFMGALAIVQILCAAAGAIYTATGGVAMLGLVGMIAIIASLYLVIGALALMANIDNAVTNLEALAAFMKTMTGVLVVLALVGPLATAGLPGMAGLIALTAGIGVLAVAIGAIMNKIPVLQKFLDSGLSVLIQIAGGIGEMIGAFVGGIMTQISKGLPEIGTNLSMFMANVMPFINGAKTVDKSVLTGVGILTGAILALTAANLLDGISKFLTGGTSFATLGYELSMFMMGAMPFINGCKMLNPKIMESVESLAQAILTITKADVINGMTSWLTGGSSLVEFGSQLGGLGTHLRTFVSNLGTFDETKINTINCACNAIESLAKAASKLPNEGGLWGSLVGENSLAAFGNKLPGLATSITGFIDNLGTFDDSTLNTVECACDAIKALASAASEIPNEGGLWALIAGDNGLASFSGSLPKLGTDISGFIVNLGTFDDNKLSTVECACNAIKALADAASKIPNEGGLWAAIAGDNGLTAFSNKLPSLGSDLSKFVTNLGTFDESKINTIKSATDAIKVIADMSKNFKASSDKKDFSKFGEGMVTLATKIKEFSTKLKDVSITAVNDSVAKVKAVVDFAKDMTSIKADSLNSFSKSLVKVAEDGVDGFVDELEAKRPKDNAKKAAKNLLDAFIEGLKNKDKTKDIKEAAKAVGQAAADNFCTDTIKSDATSAGKDLVQGLINGLNNNDKRTQVYNAAFSLGELAVQGELDGQKSNSPSKATTQAGKWLGEGLIIGIKKIGSKVYGAGKSMGEEATNSISNALNTAINLLNSDMDAQPTIRPVLDLSEVESGAGYLNRLFNNGPSVGVSANLRAISSNMNSKNQNGATDEVVSAINGLRNDLGNVGGNTYNVNGVTYDDGSNLKEAVQAIVRAAKIERRT